MITTKKTKSELEISFINYYRFNRWRLYSLPIFVASLIIFFLDYNIDFNIYFYFLILFLLSLIFIKSNKKSLAKNYVKSAELLREEDIIIDNDLLKIKTKDNTFDINKDDCGFSCKNGYLFIRTLIKIEKSITTKLIVVKCDSSELLKLNNSTKSKFGRKYFYKNAISAILFIVSFCFSSWKIDAYVLNKFVYNHNVQWEIVSIKSGNKTIINRNSSKLDYLGLKNNFTLDTSRFFCNQYFFNYRHEPFFGVRLLYGSGVTRNHKMDSLIRIGNVLGTFSFKYELDTLRLTNNKYRITCRKRK